MRTAQNGVITPAYERHGLVLYVWGVIASGAGVIGALAPTFDPATATGAKPSIFWLFAGLLIAGELKAVPWIRKQDGGEMTASWSFAGALLLIAPALSAVVAMALASAIGDLAHRKSLTKTLFNASNVALSLATGAAVLQVAGRGADLLGPVGPSLRYLIVIAVAVLAVYFVNAVLTCIVIALSQRIAVWPAIRANVVVNFTADGMLFALSPVLVVVANRSPLLLPMVLVTAWAVYRSATLATVRQHEATHDHLTGLANRTLFRDHAQAMLARARRRGQRAAVIILDLDGFKEINDRLGHHIGDAVLQTVAERMQGLMQAHQLLGRLGGDEFAICTSALDDGRPPEALARSLLRELRRPLVVEGFPLAIDGSFGVAVHPDHGNDVSTLMRHADLAMYEAKRSRRGVHVYRAEASRPMHGRLSLLADLQVAIAHGDLTLHYQPKVAMASRRVVGVEALVRWNHPQLGAIKPAEFVPLAEHTELMHPFTDFVLREALRQCREWQSQDIYVAVAVNASARNVHDRRFPYVVERRLSEAGIDPAWLEIEITENTVMADPARTAGVLQQLRAMGVSLSIDDFGTGFSSLSNLRDLPVDHIKIDRSFVSRMEQEPRDRLIVKSMLELASSLELGTIAEGVETTDSMEALAAMGCDIAQGYLFSRAKNAAALTPWLRSNSLTAPAVGSGGLE